MKAVPTHGPWERPFIYPEHGADHCHKPSILATTTVSMATPRCDILDRDFTGLGVRIGTYGVVLASGGSIPRCILSILFKHVAPYVQLSHRKSRTTGAGHSCV